MGDEAFPKYGYVSGTVGARRLGCICVVDHNDDRTTVDTNGCAFHRWDGEDLRTDVEAMRERHARARDEGGGG